MHDVVIGILGGMGPEASAKFYTDFTKATKAKKDQEHYRLIIDSNSKIPDRSEHIIASGDSPVPSMLKSIELFNYVKADVVLITCITAHIFIDEIKIAANMPVLNALELTNLYLKEKYGEVKLGILATNGSVLAGVFDKYLDFKLLYPRENSQQMLMAAIYGDADRGLRGIKRHSFGDNSVEKATIRGVARELIEAGANVLISGCTEIPLVLDHTDMDVNIVNPMDILIQHILNKYK